MLTVRYTAKFLRMYKGLEQRLKEEVKEKISLFRSEKNHASLKIHRLHGRFKSCFSFTINYKIRIVFKYEDKKTVNLLYVGSHDETYARN